MGFVWLLTCFLVACGGTREGPEGPEGPEGSASAAAGPADFELFIKKIEARHSRPRCEFVDAQSQPMPVRVSVLLNSDQLDSCARVAKARQKDIDLATRRFLSGYEDFREWPMEGGFAGLEGAVLDACLPLSDLMQQIRPGDCLEGDSPTVAELTRLLPALRVATLYAAVADAREGRHMAAFQRVFSMLRSGQAMVGQIRGDMAHLGGAAGKDDALELGRYFLGQLPLSKKELEVLSADFELLVRDEPSTQWHLESMLLEFHHRVDEASITEFIPSNATAELQKLGLETEDARNQFFGEVFETVQSDFYRLCDGQQTHRCQEKLDSQVEAWMAESQSQKWYDGGTPTLDNLGDAVKGVGGRGLAAILGNQVKVMDEMHRFRLHLLYCTLSSTAGHPLETIDFQPILEEQLLTFPSTGRLPYLQDASYGIVINAQEQPSWEDPEVLRCRF